MRIVWISPCLRFRLGHHVYTLFRGEANLPEYQKSVHCRGDARQAHRRAKAPQGTTNAALRPCSSKCPSHEFAHKYWSSDDPGRFTTDPFSCQARSCACVLSRRQKYFFSMEGRGLGESGLSFYLCVLPARTFSSCFRVRNSLVLVET